MAILYAVVARGTVVLAEFAAVTGNVGALARRILEKLPPDSDSRLCFSQDRYIFHVLRSDGITFLCMANETFGSEFKAHVLAFPLYHPYLVRWVFFMLFGSLAECMIGSFEAANRKPFLYLTFFQYILGHVANILDLTFAFHRFCQTMVLCLIFLLCLLIFHHCLYIKQLNFVFYVSKFIFSYSVIYTVFICFSVGRVPFLYLEDIHMRFMKNYGRVAHSALAYAMNDEFSRVLHQQMEFFSSNPSADTLNRVRGEVSEASFEDLFIIYCFLKKNSVLSCISFVHFLTNHFSFLYYPQLLIHTIMVDNIDKILDRGDRISLLVDKTATMQDSAFHFRKQSRRLRRALWMKNAKLLAVLTVAIALLLYVIIAACCGGITLPSCRSR
ncbi:unnamed protein product [Musa hybrid cultivar]